MSDIVVDARVFNDRAAGRAVEYKRIGRTEKAIITRGVSSFSILQCLLGVIFELECSEED